MTSTTKEENDFRVQEFEEKSSDFCDPPVVYPEGGSKAWCTVAGALIVQFCSFGYINSFGVYQDFYTREYLQNSTTSSISWIGSVQSMLLLAVGFLSGKALDAGYFHHVMAAGSTISVLCLFFLSLTHPGQYYQVFLSQGLGLGLGLGLIFVPSLGVLTHHFQRKCSLAMGIAVSGSSLGGVLHPIMLNRLFQGKAGFHNGVRINAGFIAILLILANFLMTQRVPPKRIGHSKWAWVKFFKEPAFCAAISGDFFTGFGFFFPAFYLQLYGVMHQVAPGLAFYSMSIMNVASAVGRIVSGFLAGSVGVYNLIIPSTLACGVILLAFSAVRDAAGLVVFAILYGFFSGAWVTLLGPMFSNLANNADEVGMGVGFANEGVASLIGPPLMGALLTSHFTWLHPILFSGISFCVGSVLLTVSRHFVAKARGTHIC